MPSQWSYVNLPCAVALVLSLVFLVQAQGTVLEGACAQRAFFILIISVQEEDGGTA